MRPRLVVAAAVAAAVGCGTNPCKQGTLLVTLTFTEGAREADTLDITVRRGSAIPVSQPFAHSPDVSSGTIEIDFPHGYPAGERVEVTVIARKDGVTVATGMEVIPALPQGCGTLVIGLGAGTGGTGGGGATGGAGGMGGTAGTTGGAAPAGTGGVAGTTGGGEDAGTGGRAGATGGAAGVGTGGVGGTTGAAGAADAGNVADGAPRDAEDAPSDIAGDVRSDGYDGSPGDGGVDAPVQDAGMEAAPSVCGDGVMQEGETCDTAGGADTATCNGTAAGTVRCKAAVCGDGYANAAAGEQCDVGTANTATCNGASAPAAVRCKTAACGDGYVNSAAGETCDVAGGVDSVTCNGTAAGAALWCKLSSCGDGYINAASMEFCDDRNPFQGDGCDSSECAVEPGYNCMGTPSVCTPICGDGLVVGTEVCDDRNSSSCGICSANCMQHQPLAPATGSITAVPAAMLMNGETFTLYNGLGGGTVTFEFNTGTPASGHVGINQGGGGGVGVSASVMAMRIAAAINTVLPLRITAVVSGTNPAQVLLTNDRAGSAGNQDVIETVAASGFLVTRMSGGAAGDCAPNVGCAYNQDCQSLVCSSTSRTCAVPTCTDNVLNGAEADVDCGGGACTARCGAGKKCTTGSDCTSGTCNAGSCL
jgi:cysteine-rich repeat protein